MGVRLQAGGGRGRRDRGFLPVSETVDRRDENAFRSGGDDVHVAATGLSAPRAKGDAGLEDRRHYGFHLRTVTVVPRFFPDWM